MNDTKLHQIQRDALNILLYSKEARFTDLNIHALSNDHFSFHIRKLQKDGFILKNGDDKYELTVEGKSFVTSIDFVSNRTEKRQKVIGLVVFEKIESGIKKYLSHQRKRQPYYDYFGFPTARIPRGESFAEYTAKEISSIVGLSFDIKFLGIEHKMDYSQSGDLYEDNIFVMYRAEDVSGTLTNENEAGKNVWMSIDEIKAQEYVFENVYVAIDSLNGSGKVFSEHSYAVDRF